MTTISDLPREMVGEILTRVSLTSLSAVRSTCKTWNALSKNQVLGQKSEGARNNQLLEFMVVGSSVFSLRFDLQGIRNDDKDCANPSMKKIRIHNHQVEISRVIQCDGLLLCILKHNPMEILVWNPYLGQSRLIQMRNSKFAWYALGYDTNRNHKILRVVDEYLYDYKCFEVYDFSSDSWRVYDANHDYYWYRTDVSLKGNTYFISLKNVVFELACFDFTTERFRQLLPLPYTTERFRLPYLFGVRDEKLAALYYLPSTLEIWITTKIEPNAVSWSTFLRLDMRLINGLPDNFPNCFEFNSFFIDEEKKDDVLIRYIKINHHCQMACIIGKDGYFKCVNTRVWMNTWNPAYICSSYVPSLVQVQINQQGETE